MPERECFALALDGEGRQVDSITSNIGHLLWSGSSTRTRRRACPAPHGQRPVFGLGSQDHGRHGGRLQPIGYHVGTVWPHDNSFIALGLIRYGYHEEAATIASGILEAARYFRNRLPEAFAGYPRERTRFPVEYPTACSPQAWATGAPLLFLRTMLGLEPRGNRLVVDAALPPEIEFVEIRGLPGRWGSTDVVGRRAAKVPAA
jgi:glycogen debranching enzyme